MGNRQVNARKLAEGVLSGDTASVARAITAIESGVEGSELLLKLVSKRARRAFVIGVTGPPGAGKSSVIDRLISEYRRKGSKVGVVAIDPSSPVTGGALLGDRIRMAAHAGDRGVFVRSMATRGWTGGLSRAASNTIRVLDSAGFDVIFIETAGTGQSDVEVAAIVDAVIIVLMPGAGDEIQASKAGLMEIGDVFVVNKSDIEGADKTVVSVLSAVKNTHGRSPYVVKVSALKGEGFDVLVDILEKLRASPPRRTSTRELETIKEELVTLARSRIIENLGKISSGPLLEKLAGDVASGKASLDSAAAWLARLAGAPRAEHTQDASARRRSHRA